MLIPCHDCDLIVKEPPVAEGDTALCPRCGALLRKRRRDSIERSLALTVAGVFLFVVACSFPFLTFDMQGNEVETTLASGSFDLFAQGQPAVGALVLLTTMVAPIARLSLMLYVLAPLHLGFRVRGMVAAFRWVGIAGGWSMMEVFLIGILVSLVKLADMADIIPGVAIWAFALLIPTLAATSSVLDPQEVWDRLEAQP